MKKMLKSLMLILASFVMFVSCDQKTKELKEQVDKYNEECPVSFGDMMTLNSVILNENEVEMKITANESMASISALNNHKEDVKEIMSMSLSKESSKKLVDKIIEAGANLRTIIVGGQSGMRAECKLTAGDLKAAKERFANMTEGQKLIASNVLGMKIKVPVQIDEMTTLTGMSITPSYLVYKYDLNDRETGNDLHQFIGLMKAITMSQMSSQISLGGMLGERNRQFFQALVDCGQGVKAEYHETNTGSRASFEISVSEMKDILSGKYQNNGPSMEDWEKLSRVVEQLDSMYVDYDDNDYNVVSEDTAWAE